MNPRALELINLELDDRLDDAGRAELDPLLAAEPALRAHREQLRAVERVLAAAPTPELPQDFRDTVLKRASLLQRNTGRPEPRRRRWRGVLALAASVLVAVIVLRMVDTDPIAPDQVSGTLAPAAGPTVSAKPAADGLRLSFDIPAGPPGELVIEFAHGGRRIVVPAVAPGRMTLQVAGNAGDLADFKATLQRDGVVTAVTQTR